jgi:hypothetical protein
MTDTDIHSCGYYCDRPLCIKAQRDELRNKMFSDQAIKTYSGGKSNYTQPDEALMKRVMDGIPDMPIKVQDKRSFEEFAQSFAQSAQVIGIPKKEWVGLTEEDIKDIEGWVEFKEAGSNERVPLGKLALYISHKIREKNE